jgi:hypothetical protein
MSEEYNIDVITLTRQNPPEKNNKIDRVNSGSKAVGNKQVEILNHRLINKAGSEEFGSGVLIEFMNISGMDIGKITFNVIFFDIQGNTVDRCEKSIKDLIKDSNRSLFIESGKAKGLSIVSYDVNITNVIMTPLPVVIGNDRIKIISHNSKAAGTEPRIGFASTIEIAIRNISKTTIATAIFDVIFYDSEGIVLDSFKHMETELKSNSSRLVTITTEKVKYELLKSYSVVLLKTITVDTEKIQLIRYEMRLIKAGEVEISAIIKNISSVKVNAVLAVVFKDLKEEKIGTKMILIKDIEPGNIKKVNFVFNLPIGESVKMCTFDVGEVIEDN